MSWDGAVGDYAALFEVKARQQPAPAGLHSLVPH